MGTNDNGENFHIALGMLLTQRQSPITISLPKAVPKQKEIHRKTVYLLPAFDDKAALQAFILDFDPTLIVVDRRIGSFYDDIVDMAIVMSKLCTLVTTESLEREYNFHGF